MRRTSRLCGSTYYRLDFPESSSNGKRAFILPLTGDAWWISVTGGPLGRLCPRALPWNSVEKSDSLKYAVNRATLSGPKTKQHRIRQNGRFFVKALRLEHVTHY